VFAAALALGAGVPLDMGDAPAVGVALVAGVPLDVGVDVTRTVAVGVASCVAVGPEDVFGVGVAMEIVPEVSESLPAVMPSTITSVIVEMKAESRPASQVDLGARKPASMGGRNGTGPKTNWNRIARTGSLAELGLPSRTVVYRPETAQMTTTGQIACDPKTSDRMLRMSSR
jgi:hypothetical protein